jgi:hypothetical protein
MEENKRRSLGSSETQRKKSNEREKVMGKVTLSLFLQGMVNMELSSPSFSTAGKA